MFPPSREPHWIRGISKIARNVQIDLHISCTGKIMLKYPFNINHLATLSLPQGEKV